MKYLLILMLFSSVGFAYIIDGNSYNYYEWINVTKNSTYNAPYEIAVITLNWTTVQPYRNNIILTNDSNESVDFYRWYETNDSDGFMSNATIIFNVSANGTYRLYWDTAKTDVYNDSGVEWLFLDFNSNDDITTYATWSETTAGDAWGVSGGQLFLDDGTDRQIVECSSEKCINSTFVVWSVNMITDRGANDQVVVMPYYGDDNNRVRITHHEDSNTYHEIKVSGGYVTGSFAEAFNEGNTFFEQWNRSSNLSESSFYDMTNSHEDHRSKDFSGITSENFAVEVSDAKVGWNFFCFDCYHNLSDVPLVTLEESVEGYYYLLTETYDLNVLELEEVTFSLLFENVTTNVTDIDANLTWNNTVYGVTGTKSGDDYTFSQDITMPSLTANATVDFNWTYVLQNDTADLYSTSTTTQTQTIYNVNFTNCSGGDTTTEFITFFIVDEETETALENGTAEVEISCDYGDFSFSYGDVDHNFSICGYPPGETLTVDIQVLEYAVDGYDSRSYFLDDDSISNATDNITLYLLNSSLSTDVTFMVEDLNANKLSGHYLRIRKYMGGSSYPVIAECLTNAEGECVEPIELNNYYKFTVLGGSTVLTLENPEAVKITGTEHTVTVRLGGLGDYWDYVGDVAWNCTTNTTANYTVCEWTDSSGDFTRACLNVTSEIWNTTTAVYEDCGTSSSSSLSYTYADPSLLHRWCFSIEIEGTEEEVLFYTCDTFSGTLSPTYDSWSLFLAFIIVLTFMIAGATQGASASLIGMGLGFAMVALLDLVAVSIAWVIGIFMVGVIAAYMVNR